jgi:hypothetical protein
MFERYTERARRVIFFARYEAAQYGQQYIESEHLLLALFREAPALMRRVLAAEGARESIRASVQKRAHPAGKISTSVDLPLSNECKRILAYAAEESAGLKHAVIEVTHLLLGILREKKCFAARLLTERGVELDLLRESLEGTSVPITRSLEVDPEATPSGGEGQGCLEILENGVRLALISLAVARHVPRVGESVELQDAEFSTRTYNVINVTHYFGGMSTVEAIPLKLRNVLQRLIKIVVQVKAK